MSFIPGVGFSVAASTLVATGADERVLERARALLSSTDSVQVGASLLGDVLVVRGIADRCEPLFDQWRAVWQEIRPFTVGRAASVPRIWHT